MKHEKPTEELAELMSTHNKLLWYIAGGILRGIGSIQDIEECVADVYIDYWRNPSVFNPEKGNIRNCLCVMCKSRALDRIRKLSRNNPEPLAEDEAAPGLDIDDELIERELFDKLNEAVDALPEPDREIVTRRYFFTEKPAEIAEKTALPLREISNRLYQAKLRLRKILNDED